MEPDPAAGREDQRRGGLCGKADGSRAEGRKKKVGILFEKMDDIWLRMQDSYHKRVPKQEMKVFTMHEGWDANSIKEGLWKSILLKKE